jgi:hypothetical protein
VAEIVEKGSEWGAENREEVPRIEVGQIINDLPVHPNQVKVHDFVYNFGFSNELRGHLRNAVNYARATKSGGHRVPAQRLSKRAAKKLIFTWDQNSKQSVGDVAITRVVKFVYDDPEL